MKTIQSFAMSAVFLFGTITAVQAAPVPEDSQLSFRLDFSREITAEKALGHARNIQEKFQVVDENFIDGPGGMKAFVLTPANGSAKVYPRYVYTKNFNIAGETISFYFKVLKQIPGKNVRFFHLFVPEKAQGKVMILYSYLDAKGNYHTDFQFNGNNGKINYIRMVVLADKIKAGEFTRIDIANNKEKAQLYVNGTLADEKTLPPAFADAADHDLSSVVQDFDAEPDQLRKLLAEVLLEIEKSVNFDLHRFCGGLQNKFRIHFKSFPDDKFPETIYNDFEI